MTPSYLKENENAFAKCTLTSAVPPERSTRTFTSCGLTYLEQYVVYLYVEDVRGFNDGLFAPVIPFIVPSSNALTVQPALGTVAADGTSLTFVARENGQAWCMISHVQNRASINIQTMKDPIYANSPTCASTFAVSAGVEVACNLSGCGLRVDALYLGFVYVENNDPAGADKGALSVEVVIAVPVTNTFVRSPVRVATAGEFAVEFEVATLGNGWGMIVRTSDAAFEEIPITDFKSGLTWGSRAAPIMCSLVVPAISGTQTWTFSNCNLTAGVEYSACVYIEDANGNNDGVTACVVQFLLPYTNALNALPTASLSGDVLTVNVDVVNADTVRIAAAPMATDILDGNLPCDHTINVAAGATAVPYDCGPQRDPLQYFAVYVDGRWTPPFFIGVATDTRVAPTNSVLLVLTTNTFVDAPRISGAASPSGITFTFIPHKDGKVWALVTRTLGCVSGRDTVRGVNAIGREGACFRRGENVTAMVAQTIQLVGCDLIIGEMYYALVYIEGHDGLGVGDDGEMGPPIEAFVPPTANSFVDPPAMLKTYNRTHVAFGFTPAQSGRVWAAVLPTRKAPWVTIAALKEHWFTEPDCRINQQPISLEAQELHLPCVLESLAVYSLMVYVDDGGDLTPGMLSDAVVFTVPPSGAASNDFGAWPILAQPATFGDLSSEVVVMFEPWTKGKLWMYIARSTRNFDLTAQNVKQFLEFLPQSHIDEPLGYLLCRKDGVSIDVGMQTHTLSHCRLDFRLRHDVLMYIEDDLGLNDGTMGLPLRVTDQQNTFVQYPYIIGRPTRTNVQGAFKVFVYIAGQLDDPDERGAMAPFVYPGVRRADSNRFNTMPYLYQLSPTELSLRFKADIGWAWAVVVPVGATVSESGTKADICSLPPQNITEDRETFVLTSCPFVPGEKYEAYVYVAQADLAYGVLASFEFSQFFDLSYIEIGFDLPVAHQGGDPVIEWAIMLDGKDFARTPLYESTQHSSRVIPCILGMSYTVRLQAKNRIGWSPLSEPITMLCAQIPTAPTLSIVGAPLDQDPTKVLTLAWTEPTFGGLPLASYRLYRDQQLIYEGKDSIFPDPDVIRGPRYLYWVTAVTAFAEGPPSEPIPAILKTVPMAPPVPELEVVSSWEMRVRWETPNSGGGVISSYQVLRKGPLQGDAPQIVFPLSNFFVALPLVFPGASPAQLQIVFHPSKAGRARAYVMDGKTEMCVREWEAVGAVATTWDLTCSLRGLWQFAAYVRVEAEENGQFVEGELSPTLSFFTVPEPAGTRFLDVRAELTSTTGATLHITLDRPGDVGVKVTPWYDDNTEINCGPANISANLSAVTVFSGCDFPIGIYHVFHLTVGSTTTKVEIPVSLRSNWFVTPPHLTGTPVFEFRIISVTLNLGSAGRIWALLIKEVARAGITAMDIRNQNEDKSAAFDPLCRFDGVAVVQGEQEVELRDCGVGSNTDYYLHLYIEDLNGRSDGTLSGPIIVSFPDNGRRNTYKIMPRATFVSAHSIRFSMQAFGYSVVNTAGKVFAMVVDAADEDQITQQTMLSMNTALDTSKAVGGDNCKILGTAIDLAPVELELFDCDLIPGNEYVMPVLVSDGGATLAGYGTMTIPDTHLRLTIPWRSNTFIVPVRDISLDPLVLTFTPEAPGRVCIGLRPPGSALPTTFEEAQAAVADTDPCFVRCPIVVPDSQVTITFACAVPVGTWQLLVYLNGNGPQDGQAVSFPLYVAQDIAVSTADFDEWPSWIAAEGALTGVLRLVPAQPGVLSAWVSTQPRSAISGIGQFVISDCRVVKEAYDARPIEINWRCPTPQGRSPLYVIIVFNGVFIQVASIYVPWPTVAADGPLQITDRLLAPQVEVSYQVRAVNELGIGLDSLPVTKPVTTPPAQPFPPQVRETFSAFSAASTKNIFRRRLLMELHMDSS